MPPVHAGSTIVNHCSVPTVHDYHMPEQPDAQFHWCIFSVHFVAKQYILQQKCLKKWVESCILETWRYNFTNPESHNTQLHINGQTDRRHYDANGRSYCVAGWSAKNWALFGYITCLPCDLTRNRFNFHTITYVNNKIIYVHIQNINLSPLCFDIDGCKHKERPTSRNSCSNNSQKFTFWEWPKLK